ncbi:class I SAM-dependent RNA methyltransferase [Sulfitobacter sp. D35]|uniref:THUMP domain-containing class I SAM-dependent RNA methyltransferase n=1 Tax=Sulfitobacter sp. D35 TaxID=3083252 RepID=UPI00296FDF79|nr:class I SAM-dependent RNA methyltransferase [Sulfitobacter sp. D35]MDW4499447.1 class I SAM-dependent RNA methyltransferase [Sulfitobacter sp. D35]
MSEDEPFEILLVTAPGLEDTTRAEARALSFETLSTFPGGVTLRGTWRDVWRANLHLRTATRVLARVGEFRAMHLAQLDKRARRFDLERVLPQGSDIRVDVTCRRSRIYHDRAAAQRISAALESRIGARITAKAALRLVVRIEDDLCTFSVDTSGEPLHKRGHKPAVGKAPMRETLAAAFLKDCGFDGGMPVVDPMCGSGTFVIEAAEIAAGLSPGRGRSFAFERLPGFDAQAWQEMRAEAESAARVPEHAFVGSDRDDGAIRNAKANAAQAGVGDWTRFVRCAISDAGPPDGAPGLVIVNPPYGARIGDRKLLFSLYGALGRTLIERFSGWRVGLVTSDKGLAKATGLEFEPVAAPVSHGGLRIFLFRTAALG